MGLLDIATNVVASFKADTSDMRAGLKDLQGYEKELGQAQLDGATARNAQLEDWCKGLDKVKQGMHQLKEVADFVLEAWKGAVHEARLETAAMGVDIDNLSRASGGLKNHLDLLDFAAKANHASFHLTNNELATMAAAMRTLTERGWDAKQVQEDFLASMSTGRTRDLQKYGFAITDLASNTSLAGEKLTGFQKTVEGVGHTMPWMTELASHAGDGLATFGEEGEQAGVKFTDAWDGIKNVIGQVADGFAPLAGSLAKTAKELEHVVKVAEQFGGSAFSNIDKLLGAKSGSAMSVAGANISNVFEAYDPDTWLGPELGNALKGEADRMREQWRTDLHRDLGFALDAVDGQWKQINETAYDWMKEADQAAHKNATAAAAEWKKQHEQILALIKKTVIADGDLVLKELGSSDWSPGAGGADARRQQLRDMLGADEDPRAYQGGDHPFSTLLGPNASLGAGGLGLGTENASMGESAEGVRTLDEEMKKLSHDLIDVQAATDSAMGASSKTALEKIFGAKDEFRAYEEMFKGLTKAVTSSFNAWIEGSESAGSAFKKSIGQAVEAVADQMLVEGMKNEAMALGALFMPGMQGQAAGFAAAGAEDLIVAALAGTIAQDLGASWGVGKSPAAGAGAGKGGGSGGGSAPQTAVPTTMPVPTGNQIIIVYSDPFADMNGYQRQGVAQQLVETALGSPGSRNQ